MAVVRVPFPAEILNGFLPDIGPVKDPVGDRIARIRMQPIPVKAKSSVSIGVWECSPGSWRRQVMDEEFAHFLSGKARFTPDLGEPIDIDAGDALWFSRNCTGTWEVIETVRKVYILVGEPSGKELLRELVSRLFRWRPRPAAIRGLAAPGVPAQGRLARQP
jgi:uncharacterized cupin superfamily protein